MRFFYYALFVCLVFSCSENNDLPSDSPGKIGNEVLTSNDLFLWIIKSHFDNLSESLRIDTLQAFINRELIKKVVESSDIINDSSLVKKLRKWERDKLARMLFERQIRNKILSEERLSKLYKEMEFERQISILTIKYGQINGRTKEQAKKLIEEIYQKSHSTPFLDLVKKYAEDSESLRKGGIYGWVGKHIIGRKNVIMDSVIWNIKINEVSKPVHTENRFVLVKVLDERKTYWANGERDIKRIKPFAVLLWKDEFTERDKAYLKKLREKYDYGLNQEAIEAFIKKYTKEKESLNRNPLKIINSISDFESLGFVLDKVMNKKWFLNRVSESDNIQHVTFTNRENFERFLDSVIRIELVCKEARELGYDKEEGYNLLLKKYKLDFFYSYYLNNYVYNKIEPAEEEIKLYYDRHEDQFKTEEKVRIAVIEVSRENEANELYKRLQSGESFEELARQFNEKRHFKYDYGDIPAFSEQEYKSISDVVFNMNINEIYPPKKYKNSFIIIKLLEIIPSQTKFYNEVKGDIKKILINSSKKEATVQVLRELHKKYNVVVNVGFIDSQLTNT
jgi:peptidyl-prolyl cis-trans isomerase C